MPAKTPNTKFIQNSPRLIHATAQSANGASSAHPKQNWWDGTVGYQVYVLSFADSNGDGIGDLNGIIERLPHIKWLGADIVWVNPFYSSPGFDHGYDVADYQSINPQHGTMADAERLIEATHELGMAFVLDVVPNHTSHENPWFVESRSSRDNPKRDWYLWRDPAPDGGPPNNWLSHFGGPAWTLDPQTEQYYCHLFTREQPDLNWRNPEVQHAFDEILTFWCDKGVDGFRIDVAHGMIKHPDFPDNPLIAEPTAAMGARERFQCYDHKYDLGLPEAPEVFRAWHDTVAPYDALLLAEIHFPQDPVRFARYVDGGKMDLGFHLPMMWMDWQPEQFVTDILGLDEHARDGVSWVLSNHDGNRPVSRFGGEGVGLKRCQMLSTAMFALGGVPFLFNGEELGLPNADVDESDLTDPQSVGENKDPADSRDVCRTPMPWEDGPTNGFTTAASAWLKSEPRPTRLTVAGQRSGDDAVDGTALAFYRSLIQLRRDKPELWQSPVSLAALEPVVLEITRGNLVVVANLSAQSYEWQPPAQSPAGAGSAQPELIFSSDPSTAASAFTIPAETTLVFEY